MPWIRLRHHCRFFFRQLIFSDMMIFQKDMVKGKGQRLQSLLPDSRFQFAFPNDDSMPSHFCQPMQHLMVPFLIPMNLILPELGVRFRHNIVFAAFMSMPKIRSRRCRCGICAARCQVFLASVDGLACI